MRKTRRNAVAGPGFEPIHAAFRPTSYLGAKLGFVEALECAFELGDTAKLEQLLEIIEGLRPGERPPLLEAHAARFRAKLADDAAAAARGFRRAADIFRERELERRRPHSAISPTPERIEVFDPYKL